MSSGERWTEPSGAVLSAAPVCPWDAVDWARSLLPGFREEGRRGRDDAFPVQVEDE